MSHSHTCHLLVSDLLSTALQLGVGGGMKQTGSKILMFNCDSSASDSWRFFKSQDMALSEWCVVSE